MMDELIAKARQFDAETKKMFRSCTFAAFNIYGPRSDWEAWGDFKRKSDALGAARMWGMAFKKGVSIVVEGSAYRVSAKV